MSEEQNIKQENSKEQITNPQKGNADGKTSQPENSQAPTPELTNQQSSTENMETHAHHLHKAPGQGWKHYLFEFFMLFLAVFCGFLAEYALEHKIETNRAKQYALSMVEDLRLDTSALNKIILLRANRIKMFDSLFLLLNESKDSANRSKLYFLSFRVGRIATIQFISNDRTIQQLKSSGSLRLIRKQDVSDSIVMYDGRVRQLEKIQEREEQTIRDRWAYFSKIFDARVFYFITDENDRLKPPAGNPALLRYSKEDLNDVNISLTRMKGGNIAARAFSIALRDKAVNVMNTIKKEYHIK